jgi:hypothetical protein
MTPLFTRVRSIGSEKIRSKYVATEMGGVSCTLTSLTSEHMLFIKNLVILAGAARSGISANPSKT